MLESEVNAILAPRYTFENVSESGIMICGKEGNIALAKSTLFEIFTAFNNVCPIQKFEEALWVAGRRSALHFSDDFRKVMTIDNVTQLPNSEEKFMNLYSKFDYRSAWWEAPVDYFEAGTANDPYVSATVKKPFTSFPWSDGDLRKNNAFLLGYIQTLYNCSSDILRVISETRGIRMGERKFALKIVTDDQPDQETEFIQLYYTKTYIQEWISVDQMIYYIIAFLVSAEVKEDIIELVSMFGDLKERILRITGIVVEKQTDYENVINSVRKSLRDVSANKLRLHFLLNDIRILYEDYRIKKLEDAE